MARTLLLVTAALLAALLSTPAPATPYASMQICGGYGSWVAGGAYNQMQISKYTAAPSTNCKLAVTSPTPNPTTYAAGQTFSLQLTSTSSLGYKIVAVGGATLSQPSSGGVVSNGNCIDYDPKRRSVTFTLKAPTKGSEIRVKAICGTNEQVMYVAPDLVWAAGPDVQAQAADPSTDPAYQYQQTLGTGFTLFFKQNATHLDIKAKLDRGGYVSFGAGSAMVPSMVMVGMDPGSNPGYNSVALYKIVAKTGTNAQIATLQAAPANLAQYGVRNAAFAATGSSSILTFSVEIAAQSSLFTLVSSGGVDCVYAAGSSAAFGQHSIAGSMLKMNFASGSNAGGGSGGGGGNSSSTTPISSSSGASSDPNYDYEIALNAQMKLFYRLNNTHIKFKMTMTTSGYLSLGAGNLMVGSTCVIGMDPASNPGYPSVGVYKLNAKTGSNAQITANVATTPAALYTQFGLVDSSFTSSAAGSELKFALELSKQASTLTMYKTSGAIDAIFAGGQNAYGMHLYAGILGQVNFAGAVQGNAGGNGVFQLDYALTAHIVLMLMAWEFFCPLGVGVSLFGRRGVFFTQWFKWHWILQTIGVVAAYAGTLAGYLYVDSRKSDHFSTDHEKLGLLMLLLAIVQPVMGRLRPGKIAKSSPDAGTWKAYLRPAFQVIHPSLGYLAIVIGLATTLLGIPELARLATVTNAQVVALPNNMAYDLTGFEGKLGTFVAAVAAAILVWFAFGIIVLWLRGTGSSSYNETKTAIVAMADSGLPSYTRAQVAQQGSSEAKVWVIHDNLVYDVTSFVASHPGGKQKILALGGKDITSAFEDIGHSDAARATLRKCLVGKVSDVEASSAGAGAAATATASRAAATTTKPGGGKPVFLSGDKPRKLVKLAEKKAISPNVYRLKFTFPDSRMVLGLPIGKHITLHAPGPIPSSVAGMWNNKTDSEANSKDIARKYTPISNDDTDVGSFTLVVKVYRSAPPQFPDGGKMGKYLDWVQVGGTMEIDGKPIGTHEYLGADRFVESGGAPFQVQHVVFIAGGSGITPIYQIANAMLRDPQSKASVSLLYANSTVDDVLIKNELDDMQRRNPKRAKVWYTVSQAPPAGGSWAYSVGRISKDMVAARLAPPTPQTLVVVCGPPGLMQAARGILQDMGYRTVWEY